MKLFGRRKGEKMKKRWNEYGKRLIGISLVASLGFTTMFGHGPIGVAVNKTVAVTAKESVTKLENVVTPSAVVATSAAVITPTATAVFVAPTGKFAKKKIAAYPKEKITNKLKITGDYKKVYWSVDDTDLAKVGKTGTVYLKKDAEGKTVTVYATILYLKNGKKERKQCKYVIQGKKYVKAITLSTKQNYALVKKKLKVDVKVTPEDSSNRKLEWTCSNPKYATVSKAGYIKAKSAGAGKTVTVTAKTTDGTGITESISVRLIDLDKPIIALTFDDGPNYDNTSRIVNALEKAEARATFFVVGRYVGGDKIKNLLKRSVENGNEIGNHTYDHPQLSILGAEQVQQQIAKTDTAVKNAIGTAPSLLRPPYGAYNASTQSLIDKPFILWSVDTLDWKTRNTATTVNCIMNNAKDGDIVLMHDLYATTAAAAEQVIPKLQQKGFQLVTVSELATYKKIKLQNGKRYGNLR